MTTLTSAPTGAFEDNLTLRMQSCYLRFREAISASERQGLLDELLAQHGTLLVQRILRKKLVAYHTEDFLEVQQQVHFRLLARLRSTTEEPLQDFPAYVAVVTYNTCAEWQRQRQPRRHALKNRLRYLLTHTEGLALWEAQPRVWWCGRKEWTGSKKSADPAQLNASRPSLPKGTALRELANAFFSRVNCPIELDDLVNVLTEVLGIADETTSLDDKPEIADTQPSIDTAVERRAFLQTLWSEIKQLPVPQRRALLLNLRDQNCGNQLALFHLTGVASLRELAQTLEFTLEEFAEIWNQLPIDDLSLAARFNVTRQQIINLRLAARRRLARHLGQT